MSRVKVYDPIGKTEGELLYLFTYPEGKTGKNGEITRWVNTPQRCGVRTDDGRVIHWTMTFSVVRVEGL